MSRIVLAVGFMSGNGSVFRRVSNASLYECICSIAPLSAAVFVFGEKPTDLWVFEVNG